MFLKFNSLSSLVAIVKAVACIINNPRTYTYYSGKSIGTMKC